MVVQVFGLYRGEVVEGLVRADGVVEVDPAQCLQFDVLDVAPGPFGTNQLGLEQPDRRLGQGVGP